jgi:transketolase
LTTDVAQLEQDAREIRKVFLGMHHRAKSGHIGTGLSAIDVLAYLHKHWLRPDDAFILSKGHGASSLYAVLHHYGVLAAEELDTYYKDGTLLPAHPAPRAYTAIPAATGSLGHGLSIAAGMAFTWKKVTVADRRVACLLSDGECNEGAVWEAAAFAAHHQLQNLLVVVDANGLQGFGTTREVLDMEPLVGKWQAFGFATREVDGHDFAAIAAACEELDPARPVCVVARTRKGNGVRFMVDRMEWHYLPMSDAQYAEALRDIDEMDQEVPDPSLRSDARAKP